MKFLNPLLTCSLLATIIAMWVQVFEDQEQVNQIVEAHRSERQARLDYDRVVGINIQTNLAAVKMQNDDLDAMVLMSRKYDADLKAANDRVDAYKQMNDEWGEAYNKLSKQWAEAAVELDEAKNHTMENFFKSLNQPKTNP